MRVELFLKNGHKVTYDYVNSITEKDNTITIDYDKVCTAGDLTTCDMPSVTFDKDQVDMLKVFMQTTTG